MDNSFVCVLCGNAECKPLFRNLRRSRFSVARCQECDLEFLAPQPDREEIAQIYSADYYIPWDMKRSENEITAKMKRLTFARRLRELGEFVSSGPILDVGTATGFFLDEVSAEGSFVPYGIELSEYAGGIARDKFGAERIHIGTIETAPFPPGFFSAVTMSDLIEHVCDPAGVLRRVYELLKPGGVAMIMTPDTTSLSRRLMGRRWTQFKLEHLFYLSPATIRRMAARCGFRVLSIRRARKAMTLKYLRDQFQVYRHPVLTPLSRGLGWVLKPWEDRPFPITMGEMLVFLRKSASHEMPGEDVESAAS
jgi:2-polyprenyl-3-methyl-5-hydroxy-6-metoxy-1,4-benzoquinol methylase